MSGNEHFGGLPGTVFEGTHVDSTQLEKQKLTGIGGWLLLYVVLGCLSVLSWAITLMASFFALNGMFGGVMSGGTNSASFFDALWVVCLAVGLVLLFRRSKQAPKVNIIAMGLTIGVGLIKIFAVVSIMFGVMGDGSMVMPMFAGAVGGFILSAAINTAWIVYFLRSKRVRYTCVL